MNQAATIEFALHDRVQGRDLTPQSIGLSRFNQFNAQVEQFISGSQRQDLDQVQIEIDKGSYLLRVILPEVIFAALQPDLLRLSREDVLGEIDPKRAEVVETWQKATKANGEMIVEIRPRDKGQPIRISRKTEFRIGEVVPWVAVEQYLYGEIMDMGGMKNANLHLKLDKTGKKVVVSATQGYLRDQIENRLYHKAMLHVHAEQHHLTGELRNVRLIDFVDYDPSYNEAALDRFADVGTRAWADVPDAVQWVRETRGG